MRSVGQRINYAWRLFATGLCFSTFGIGGVLIPVLVVPCIRLLPGSAAVREHRAQAAIHHLFRMFVGMMRAVGVLSYEVHGRERLANAKLVLANHPSLIDVVFLISLIPNAKCIVNYRLVGNPFTRGPILSAGYIRNDDGTNVVEASARAFADGYALVVFPEGTRTPRNGQLQLKRGAANIAVRAPADITPVFIDCTPKTLGKGESWYHIPPTRTHFTIRIQDTIAVDKYLREHPSKAARMLTRDLTDHFKMEIHSHELSSRRNQEHDHRGARPRGHRQQ